MSNNSDLLSIEKVNNSLVQFIKYIRLPDFWTIIVVLFVVVERKRYKKIFIWNEKLLGIVFAIRLI